MHAGAHRISQLLGKAAFDHRLFACKHAGSEAAISFLQKVLGVPEDIHFESCSEKVGNALGPDVMKSAKPLIPDILSSVPLLLYQGLCSWSLALFWALL